MEHACLEGIWLSVCPFCKTLFEEGTQAELIERCQLHARASMCSSEFDKLPTLLELHGEDPQEPTQ